MPRKIEHRSMVSDQGHIFEQLMRTQSESEQGEPEHETDHLHSDHFESVETLEEIS